jgi:ubiquinone/menaquinone biosynthesis C-methylase UbiE
MSKKTDVARKYYDQLASQYDQKSQGEGKWTPPAEARKILEPLLTTKGITFLDAGIGTGQTIEFAVNKGAVVCGVDISRTMLDIAAKKFQNIELIQADISKPLPLSNRLFHIISAIGCLEFVPDLTSVLANLKKHLHPAGYLCFTFEELLPGHPLQNQRESTNSDEPDSLVHHRYTLEEVKQMLNNLGLKLEITKQFQAYLKTDKKIPIYYQIMLAKN